MTASPVTFSRDNDIGFIRLTNAAQRNAVDQTFIEALTDTVESLRALTDVRAVILEADGPHFCTGADVNALGDMHDGQSLIAQRRTAELGGRLLKAIRDIHQPTVCAIQGVAAGAGACFAAACDVRVAADTARIGYTEARMGMNLMWHAIPDVLALIGPSRTKHLLFTAKLYAADELERWGFIDQCCAEVDLRTTSLALARTYAAMPPIAVQMIKRSVNRLSMSLGEAMMHADFDQWLLTTQSDDFAECVEAFHDKRDPTLSGR